MEKEQKRVIKKLKQIEKIIESIASMEEIDILEDEFYATDLRQHLDDIENGALDAIEHIKNSERSESEDEDEDEDEDEIQSIRLDEDFLAKNFLSKKS